MIAMMQMATRAALGAVGIAAALVVTNMYYAQVVESLARLEKVADAAIPALLAVALVYRVIQNIKGK